MRIFILCGGLGSRMNDYSLPKPLNLINGTYAIKYALANLPPDVNELNFIIAPHLRQYNPDTIIANQFKTIKCNFIFLDYFTRGAIESAYIGTQHLIETTPPIHQIHPIHTTATSQSIVFLDNDILYQFPENLFVDKLTAFIGYSIDNTNRDNYSFMKLDGNDEMVIEYKEKIRISNKFCCGVYGFANLAQFRTAAELILKSPPDTELYMSLLFKHFLETNIPICAIRFPGEIKHIGSLEELNKYKDAIPLKKMRVCFDLDNTLVTYPTISGDYSTVKPIPEIIKIAQQMHSEGHTIIIYTARRMETHKNNIGAVIRDIGKVTMDTLEKFAIPYDELLFGKPIADIYIDDRACNPYLKNSIRHMGYLNLDEVIFPINTLATNKFNNVIVKNNRIEKSGLKKYLSGEVYFYNMISKLDILKNYFPQYYGILAETADTLSFSIEYIKGIPIFTLYKSQVLNTKHIDTIFEFLDILHSTNGTANFNGNSTISSGSVARARKLDDDANCVARARKLDDDIRGNYIDKLKQRFEQTCDYPFDNAVQVQSECLRQLDEYLAVPENVKILDYIHGDCWFSNIIMDFNGSMKFIDMKGQVNGQLCVGGDEMYDFGKLYQSVLGYDLILNGCFTDAEFANRCEYDLYIEQYFIEKLTARHISVIWLKTVTFGLIIGTFFAIREEEQKIRVWKWMCKKFM